MKEIIENKKLGIRVELDREQIFPEDPGQGAPVLVCFGGDSGTWNCVTSEGETADGTQLTQEQKDWLDEVTPQVEAWMSKHHV